MARYFKPKTSYLHSASSVPYSGMTLCDALDKTAEEHPDKEAFVFPSKLGGKRITYGQLRYDVIKLAAGLFHLGLKPGDRVGIWFENRYEWIITQYATAYTKMINVRFLVGYKAQQMEYLLNKTKVSTLVLGSGNPLKVFREMEPYMSKTGIGYTGAEKLPNLHRVIYLGKENVSMCRFEEIFELGVENDFMQVMEIRKTVTQDDEVLMMFTSGSTGMQKATVKSHRCVVENMYTYFRHIKEKVSKDVRYMCTSHFAHGSSDIGCIMGVISGFPVIVPEPNADVSIIAELIQKEQVTLTLLMFHTLFDFITQPQFRDYDFNSLDFILTSGNVVTKEALHKARQMITPNIFDCFGSTETGFTTFNFNPQNLFKVGYPVDHQEIKIVDDKGNIVPLNTTGELCVRSPYVFLRYEGDEEKTKEDIDDIGWFHTGDLCLMEEDGCLHVTGRKKDIIIKGGGNVYPAEIERILIRHPNVKLPQVVSVPDERLVEEICACICLENGQEATFDEIVEFVRHFLEDYNVPKYVLFFQSFPSTLSGKIDRKELPKKASEILMQKK
ncbi:medium-chain acyl-CoA ligase ACSF2, mitochondrial-like [Glandiceps talaboti]